MSLPEPVPLLAFAAHPDDIEFGAGGVIAAEARQGRRSHFVIGSRGESGSHGTPELREQEARTAAARLGATLEFLDLGGDANIEANRAGARRFARLIRLLRPTVVLAPTTGPNQHPDHAAVGLMARDATRLARYGGLEELRDLPVHVVAQLWFYVVSNHAVEAGAQPLWYALTDADVVAWRESMAAHASQAATRNYAEFSLTRARALGMQAGCGHALALYPNDPPTLTGFANLAGPGARF